MPQSRRWSCVPVLVALVACAGEAPPPAEPVEQAGECVDAYGAPLCTWAKVDDSGAVVEIGATVALASIENAPEMVEMAWPPPATATPALPAAAGTRGGFSHLTMYWEPMGHAPATFMVPHFDFHFYRIPAADRLAIDCADTTKPAATPAGYSLPDEVLPPEVAAMIGVDTLIGICVPEMGMHSLVTEELTVETPFDGTMVVGYYRGEPIFVEPMISQEFLMRRQSFDLPVPTVSGLDGAQPASFRADYDAATDAYRFTFRFASDH